jgi:hypothetical protein
MDSQLITAEEREQLAALGFVEDQDGDWINRGTRTWLFSPNLHYGLVRGSQWQCTNRKRGSFFAPTPLAAYAGQSLLPEVADGN